MSQPSIEVLDPGLLTTIQDRGRYGYQHIGVPVSGAMDEFALRAANLLVSNPDDAAALEITVVGPKLKFLDDAMIAITGADMAPTIDEDPIPQWQTVTVAKNSVLAFNGLKDGMRAYLAIAGGIDVPPVMESRSTYDKSSIGGFEGRPLRNGDVISTLDRKRDINPKSLPSGFQVPSYGTDHMIRVILGPQHSAFTENSIASFLSSIYKVSSESDRMGYSLEGPKISHSSRPDIVSDGNPIGAIQIPKDGLPRILMADRGTTGGYTKIATVINPDISLISQSMPGTTLNFKAISLDDAHELLHEREAILNSIASGTPIAGAVAKRVNVSVGGVSYDVINGSGTVLSQNDPIGDETVIDNYKARVTVDNDSFTFEVDVKST